MLPVRTISITVARAWQSLYDEFWSPEAFRRWASGLSSARLRREGESWIGNGPEGPIRVRFTDHNAYGVMDHWVDTGGGTEVFVPLRIVPNGEHAEVILTLFRQPGMDDARFEADADWVLRDLERLRDVAEQQVKPE